MSSPAASPARPSAILVDATLVRCVLVPAVMRLAGEPIWWAPGPLRRFHDRFGRREAPAPDLAAREAVPGAGRLADRDRVALATRAELPARLRPAMRGGEADAQSADQRRGDLPGTATGGQQRGEIGQDRERRGRYLTQVSREPRRA